MVLTVLRASAAFGERRRQVRKQGRRIDRVLDVHEDPYRRVKVVDEKRAPNGWMDADACFAARVRNPWRDAQPSNQPFLRNQNATLRTVIEITIHTPR